MLLQRTLTALVLAPLVILIILLPPTGVFAPIAALAFLAAWWEWAQLQWPEEPLVARRPGRRGAHAHSPCCGGATRPC